MDVGGAGGGGAVVIPEEPWESPETWCCSPVNRHGGREEERQANETCVTCGEDLWPQPISYVKHTAVDTPMLLYITHARRS